MRSTRSWVVLGAAGLAVSAATIAVGAPTATAAHSSHHTLARTAANAAALERSKPAGRVAASSHVSFELVMAMRHPAAERAFIRHVSSPTSASYRKFLTDKQWAKRYGPTVAQVHTARTWLTKHHFTVGQVPSDRLFVTGTGTAAHVAKVFSTSFGKYQVNGHTVRLTKTPATVPTAIAGRVTGIAGLNQNLNAPDITREGGTTASSAKATPSDEEPPPPAGFRNAPVCSTSWGQNIDRADSASLYAPYAGGRPYQVCGYQPGQLRSGAGVQKSVSAGADGTGVGLAIVDAYDSPTLLSDAQKYFSNTDPGNPLKSSQFINVEPSTVDEADLCDGSGWYTEQSLDVEATHAMAPGATLLYVGAENCEDSGLLAALQTAVTSGASVVSDSWGDSVGDLLEDTADKAVYDDTFMLADVTGVSVLFSSGDDGDNFATFGLDAPDYPTESPYVTSVGGLSLKVSQSGTGTAVGWSTAKQTLCAGVSTTSCGSSSTTGVPLNYLYGGGGGTSFTYNQPYYQAGVVPDAIAERNTIFGDTPTRVVPDISMDADPGTGMLIGATQTFPDGVAYGQFREGGTSLASPLFAGVVADSDSLAGQSAGFLNPTIYKQVKHKTGAVTDVQGPAVPADSALIRVDYTNTVDNTNGYNVSLRALNYEGPETYCDGTGNCATRDVTLTTAKGFDSMTGVGTVSPSFITDLAK